MLDDLKGLETRLKKLQNGGLRKIVLQIAEDNLSLLEETNREQLREGKTAQGGSLPPYSERSVREFGKPRGAIKLKETGDFYKGIDAKLNNTIIDMKGLDSKTSMLEGRYDRYGEIIGVNEANQDKYITKIENTLIDTITDILYS